MFIDLYEVSYYLSLFTAAVSVVLVVLTLLGVDHAGSKPSR